MMWNSNQFEYHEFYIEEVKRLGAIRDIETLLPIEMRNRYVDKLTRDYVDICQEEPPIWTYEVLANYLLREFLSNQSRSKGNENNPILSERQMRRTSERTYNVNKDTTLTFFDEYYGNQSQDLYKRDSVKRYDD